MKALDDEFEKLLAERAAASARTDTKSALIRKRDTNPQLPVVTFVDRAAVAMPGQEFVVRVKVTAPAGVKWIRLRYRHVNQKEDYQTADMAPGAQTDFYVARIPASFIDPHWDLMHFVEVVDLQGNGRIYPDLEVETPYIITKVAR